MMNEKKPITFQSRIEELESRKDKLNESNLNDLAQQYEKALSVALDKFNSARTKAEKQIISSEINWIMQQQINVQAELDEVLRLSEKIEELRRRQKKIRDDIEETNNKKILLKGDIEGDEVYIYAKKHWLTDIAKKMEDRTLKEDSVYDTDGKVKEYGYSELLGAARYWDLFNSVITDDMPEENTEILSKDDFVEQALHKSLADGIVSNKKPIDEEWFFKYPYTKKSLLDSIYTKSSLSWTRKSKLWFRSLLLAEKVELPGWEDIRRPWEYDIKLLYNGKEYIIHLTINGLKNGSEDFNQGKVEENQGKEWGEKENDVTIQQGNNTEWVETSTEQESSAEEEQEDTSETEEENFSENVEKFNSKELYELCRIFFAYKKDENIEEFLKEEGSYEQFIDSWRNVDRRSLPKNWEELKSALLPTEYIKDKDSAFIALVTSPIDLTKTDESNKKQWWWKQVESEISELARKIFDHTREIPMNRMNTMNTMNRDIGIALMNLQKDKATLSQKQNELASMGDMYYSISRVWDDADTTLQKKLDDNEALIKKLEEGLKKSYKIFNDKLLKIITENYPYLMIVFRSYLKICEQYINWYKYKDKRI